MLHVVIVACLLGVSTLATSSQQLNASQLLSCMLDGNCTVNYWPLQFDWLDTQLHYVVDDLNSSAALFSDETPIIMANRIQIEQRSPAHPALQQLTVKDKLIVVDYLLF